MSAFQTDFSPMQNILMSLTNKFQAKLWTPVNDVVLGAAPRAASPICHFTVHASCQLKEGNALKTCRTYKTFHVWSMSLSIGV